MVFFLCLITQTYYACSRKLSWSWVVKFKQLSTGNINISHQRKCFRNLIHLLYFKKQPCSNYFTFQLLAFKFLFIVLPYFICSVKYRLSMQNYMSEKHVTIPTYSGFPLGILFSKQNVLSSNANWRLLSLAEVVKVCIFTRHLYPRMLILQTY